MYDPIRLLFKVASKQKAESITPEERAIVKQRLGREPKCSIKKDKNGYFAYTHRARTKSYDSPNKIPLNKIKFIESTG